MRANAIYNEFVYGGHLLALGTASIAGSAALVLGRLPTLDLAAMAYLFTNGAYTINRASEADQDEVSHPQRTAYLRRRRAYLPAIAAACFGLGYLLAFERNLYFFLALLAPLVLAVLYSVGSSRMERILGSRRLKEGLLVKNLVISFGWSLVPFLVGLYYSDITLSLALLAPFIFLRLMVNTVFFDVRDVEADKMYGTRTIPSVFGSKATDRTLLGLDIASLGYVVVAVAASLLPAFCLGLAIFPFYSLAYRRASNHSNMNLVRDLVADGEYIMWMPVILLGKI